MDALEGDGIDTEVLRVVDHTVKPGVSSDEGDGAAGLAQLAQQALHQLRRARRRCP
jgi:hypothetical protein